MKNGDKPKDSGKSKNANKSNKSSKPKGGKKK